MTKEFLIEKLTELGISESLYSIDGSNIEGLVLEKTTNHYAYDKRYQEIRVFDQERGNRYNEKIFYSDSEAYEHILERFQTQGRWLR